jgi:competence protein ComEA
VFDSTRQLLADSHVATARLRALVNRADSRRPDDELPEDQPWTEEPGGPPAALSPPGRRYLSGAHGRRWLVIGLAAVVLLAAGIGIAVASGGPVAEPVTGLPAAADASAATVVTARPSTASTPRIVVSVRGKVRRPGLITLAQGARVADAIKACGGLRHGADPGALNLARKLTDGEQIYVAIPVPVGAGEPAAAPGTDAPAQAKVDINTASADQLDTLPGIGEVTAKRIVQWRQQHGRFAGVDQLQQVPGIGDAKLGSLRDLVVAG